MPRINLLFAILGFSLLPVASAADVADPCASTATSAGGVLLVCPAGDGPTLSAIGAAVSVEAKQIDGRPIPWISATDIGIMRKDSGGNCAGVWTHADGPTDMNGRATISGSIVGGGYFADGLHVTLEGIRIQDRLNCDHPLPIVWVSPDIDGDLVVNVRDLAMFAVALAQGGNGTVDPRMDFNNDGAIDQADLSLFAGHYGHRCP